jgi:eukaryotic-like serine/threonine-protein kinase
MLPPQPPEGPARQQARQACAQLNRCLRAGEPCSAEELFVAFPAAALDADAALEVIYTEFVVREELGQRPAVADWYARFPQWSEHLRQLFEVHRAVYGGADGPTGDGAAPLVPPEEVTTRRDEGGNPPTGSRRLGQYELGEEIARGGMGMIYKARQPGLDRVVALKMILAGEHASAGELARFRTEAEAVASLQHPNIVQIYEVGEWHGPGGHAPLPFLSLEYVDGGNLQQKLAASLPPPREAAGLMEVLARAVHYAHRQGVLHRDLKPANVLLTADGTPKLTDFGLAKRLDHDKGQTQSEAVLGTPSYMAPEQARGTSRDVGRAADVYSLGAILYETLTGRAPFRGQSYSDTLEQVRTQEPPPPRALQPKVPRDLETICLTCLRKEPSRRYATAGELADDLRRFGRGEPVRARRAGPLERTWRWGRRHPARAALLAAVALLVVGGVASGFWYQSVQAGLAARSAHEEAGRLRRAAQYEREVGAAARDATGLLEQAEGLADNPEQWEAKLAAADSALKRAEAFTDEGAGLEDAELRRAVEELRARWEAERKAQRLVAAIERARLDRVEPRVDDGFHAGLERVGPRVDADRDVSPQYRAAFAAFGLDALSVPADRAAAEVRRQRRPIREALVGGLDDWMTQTTLNTPEGTWVREVLNGVAPGGWRVEARAALRGRDRPALEALAERPEMMEEPAATLGVVAIALEKHFQAHESALRLLRRAQERHPGDLGINLELGRALMQSRPAHPDEALGCCWVVVALRPQYPGSYANLGHVLFLKEDYAAAIRWYERALERDPKWAPAHAFLGTALERQGKLPEAVTAFKNALACDASYAHAYYGLGLALLAQRKWADAATALNQTIKLEPRVAQVHYNLGVALDAQGDGRGAATAYRESINLNSGYAMAHNNLGKFLLRAGDLSGALASFEKALAADSKLGNAHLNRGMMLYSKADLPGARVELQKAIDLDPAFANGHAVLGLILLAEGRLAEARASTRRALDRIPENDPRGRALLLNTIQQCDHLLSLEPKLPAILRGDEKVASPAEGVLYAQLCFGQKRYAESARLYEDALKDEPALLGKHRYLAVRAAARAAAAAGKDDPPTGEAERAVRRKQALDWLTDELDDLPRLADGSALRQRANVRGPLWLWRNDVHLAGFRGPQALARLPQGEREAWQKIWDRVDALENQLRAAGEE